MSLSKIRTALITGLKVALPDIPIAAENEVFSEKGRELWVETLYSPGVPTLFSIGDNGLDEVKGYIQANINHLIGKGTGVSLKMVDDLRTYFKGGKILIFQGQEARIQTVGPKTGMVSGNRYVTPVIIDFYAHIRRP